MDINKIKSDYKRFMLIMNIVSVIIYIINTFLWIQNKTANVILKYIAVISLVVYLILFIVLLVNSKSNLGKNLKKYKKLMKNTKTILNLLNLIIIVISAFSLFSFSIQGLFSILINIFLLIVNIISITIKLFLYFVKRSIKKRFGREQEKMFTFDDESEKISN